MSSQIGSAVLDAVPGLGSAAQVVQKIPVVGGVVDLAQNAIGAGVAAVGHLLGITGDVSPFQDAQIDHLADIATDGKSWWAMEALLGESGRVGAVTITGGRASHAAAFLAGNPTGSGADVKSWWGGVAGNWGGPDGLIGPTVHVGSQDRAWAWLQKLAPVWGVTVPQPDQYQTNSPGRVTNAAHPYTWASPPGGIAATLATVAGAPAQILSGLGGSGTVLGIPVWLIVLLVVIGVAIGLKRLEK